MNAKKLPTGQALTNLLTPAAFESGSKINSTGADSERIRVTLDQLIPYDHNPRVKENPLYAEIKASIKSRGLDSVPNVSKRYPEDKKYMIKDGGNTRLAILNELVDEIDDEIAKLEKSGELTVEKRLALEEKRNRFWEIECEYKPWQSEIDTLSGHMVENEVRGGTLFIERARAVQLYRNFFECSLGMLEEVLGKQVKAQEFLEYVKENGWEKVRPEDFDDAIHTRKPVSVRDLTELISEYGWSVNAGILTVYEYTIRELLDFIPETLWAGAGQPYIKKIRSLQVGIERLWAGSSKGELQPEVWLPVWQEVLRETDASDYAIDPLRELLTIKIGKQLDIKHVTVDAALAMILQNKSIDLEEIGRYLAEQQVAIPSESNKPGLRVVPALTDPVSDSMKQPSIARDNNVSRLNNAARTSSEDDEHTLEEIFTDQRPLTSFSAGAPALVSGQVETDRTRTTSISELRQLIRASIVRIIENCPGYDQFPPVIEFPEKILIRSDSEEIEYDLDEFGLGFILINLPWDGHGQPTSSYAPPIQYFQTDHFDSGACVDGTLLNHLNYFYFSILRIYLPFMLEFNYLDIIDDSYQIENCYEYIGNSAPEISRLLTEFHYLILGDENYRLAIHALREYEDLVVQLRQQIINSGEGE